MSNIAGQDELAKKIYNSIFAPALLSFVEWVLAEAESRNIHRLYFLARDGYQMHLAAEYLCSRRNLNIDCRYLYGSRYAWRMPQFALLGKECLDMLCRGGIDVTLEKVLKRGGLTDAEAIAVAEELGLKKDYKRILSYSEVLTLKKPLAESRQFLAFVYEHSKSAYETTMGYFEQEGLFEDVPYALVDSGWTGSLQQTLAELLNHAGYKKQLEGFYFGLYELPKGVDESRYHTYYFGPNYGMKRKVYFSSSLFEVIFSAPHGMTITYKIDSGKYRPLFFREQNLNQDALEKEKQWLEQYLMEYQSHQERNTNATVYEGLKRFIGKPIKEEADLYGRLLFSEDMREEDVQEVAVKLTNEELKNHIVWNKLLIMLGKKNAVLKECAWIEGSIVRSTQKNRWWLMNIRCYKYLIYLRKWLKKGRLF